MGAKHRTLATLFWLTPRQIKQSTSKNSVKGGGRKRTRREILFTVSRDRVYVEFDWLEERISSRSEKKWGR